MAHLITPIEVGGIVKCCSATTRRTTATLTPVAVAAGTDKWTLTALGGSGVGVSGSIVFGICCASEVVVKIAGTGNGAPIDNSVFAFINLNGNQEHSYSGTDVTSYTHTETMALGDIACGNIVYVTFIAAVTVPSVNFIWELEIISIT